MKQDIYNALETNVMKSNLKDCEKQQMLKNIMQLKQEKLNIMITGPTGSGKSSTINALFGIEVANVGVGVDPETMEIQKYELDNLVLWDTPGLGDGKEADNRYARNIIDKLSERNDAGEALIDLVVVILDGGSRDLGTSYELINQVIIPNLGEGMESRVLIALNQADMAMKGRNWDFDNNEPLPVLIDFLEKKVKSIKNRVYETTGVCVDPIYYSAGYKQEGVKQCEPYNLSKLLYYIVQATPSSKRVVYAHKINADKTVWQHNDDLMNYSEETQKSIFESIMEHMESGADVGSRIGAIFGGAGEAIGRAFGGLAGGVVGFWKGVFS